MSKLKIIDAKTMEKILFNLDFAKTPQKESHAFYRPIDEEQLQFLTIKVEFYPDH